MGFFDSLDNLIKTVESGGIEKTLQQGLDKFDGVVGSALDKAEQGIDKAGQVVENVGAKAELATEKIETVVEKLPGQDK